MRTTIKALWMVAFVFVAGSLQAQWTTQATGQVQAGQVVDLEFDFASTIKINHWDKAEARAVVTVEERPNYPTPEFTIDIENASGSLSLHMSKSQFEKYWNKLRGEEENCCCDSPRMDVEVWVPEGVDIRAKSVSASIETTFDGGELSLETISGDVDIKFPSTKGVTLKASTISGDIYSDLTFEYLDQGKGLREMVGMKLDARLNNGGKQLALKSVSGDILLRKL